MNYQKYIKDKKCELRAFYILENLTAGKIELDQPSPPALIEEEDLEKLRLILNEYMPKDSPVYDLWDYDLHFEEYLEADWYFEVLFGEEKTIDGNVEILTDYFLEKIEEFSMDYDQKIGHEKKFEEMVYNWCLQFIRDWRSNLHKNFA
jgi:hypothetical protein